MGRTRDEFGLAHDTAGRFVVNVHSMQENAAPDIDLHVPADHPAFAGHFPGQPLLPGVSLLAEVLEAVLADPSLAARVGAAPRIASAKFLAPVRPGAHLVLRLQGTDRSLRFEVREGDRIAATGQFETTA